MHTVQQRGQQGPQRCSPVINRRWDNGSNSLYSCRTCTHLLASCREGHKGLIQCTQTQVMKFLAPANRHLSTPPECRGSTSHEGVTPHTKAPLSSLHSSKPPDHKYHSLLFYLVAAGSKIHKQSSLHSLTPHMWLLTSNLTENRNLSCVSVPTCRAVTKVCYRKTD